MKIAPNKSIYRHLQERATNHKVYNQIWTLENLRDGLLYYKDVHGHLPSSEEVDAFEYLPSSRSIQRTFGGLRKVRSQLGLGQKDYRTGQRGAARAQKADERAKDYEAAFYEYLISLIPEVRVHEHKVMRPGDVSCDFFIYTTENNGIVLDLLYAKNLRSLQNQINIKLKQYNKIDFATYFIVVGASPVAQKEIDRIIANRKSQWPKHIAVMTEKNFQLDFDRIIEAYSD